MGESNMSNEKPSYNPNYDTAPRKIINTVSNEPITSLKHMESLDKKKSNAGVAATVGGLLIVAASILGLSQSEPDAKSDANLNISGHSQPIPTPETNSPQVINTKEVFPPKDHEIVKVLKGPTIINKVDKEDKTDEINFRRDTKVPVANLNEPNPVDNRVDWDEIQAINGVVIGKATSFIIMDAAITEGQAVDEAGLGYYWIALPARLKDGEETTLYLSRSNKTKNLVQASNTNPVDPPKDLSKINQIILPQGND